MGRPLRRTGRRAPLPAALRPSHVLRQPSAAPVDDEQVLFDSIDVLYESGELMGEFPVDALDRVEPGTQRVEFEIAHRYGPFYQGETGNW